MKARLARKIVKISARSKRLRAKLERLYPPYYDECYRLVMPSWSEYYLFKKAWVVLHRKINRYGDNFKKI